MFRLLLQLLLADLSVLLVQMVQPELLEQQARELLEQRVPQALLALLQELRARLVQRALAQLAQLELRVRLVLKELQSMLLVQLLTLDLYLQQVQLTTRTLLLQTAICIFGMVQVGQA
jgi:hypothetical protein